MSVHTAPPSIASLHIYPVKSCGAVDVQRAVVSPRGFVVGKILDRSWMAVDANGVLVSQREQPSLARVRVELLPGSSGIAELLRLTADTMPPLVLDAMKVGDERRNIIIHRKETMGHVAPAEVSAWLSEFLGVSITVLHQKEDDVRHPNLNFAVDPDKDVVSFADGYPYLLTTIATLQKLNSLMETPVPMARFRPNIVVAGTEAEAEYMWQSLAIGDVRLSVVKPCDRCVTTTVDQVTGYKTGKDPLASLARNYFLSQKFGDVLVQGAIFGENVIPTRMGEITICDNVEIIETKPKYSFRAKRA